VMAADAIGHTPELNQFHLDDANGVSADQADEQDRALTG